MVNWYTTFLQDIIIYFLVSIKIWLRHYKFKVYEENLFWYTIFTFKIQILHTGLFIGFIRFNESNWNLEGWKYKRDFTLEKQYGV